jgi:hypothetical protein
MQSCLCKVKISVIDIHRLLAGMFFILPGTVSAGSKGCEESCWC